MGVDLAEEEQFGPYLVYERLGVGGMATVHRALERGIEGFERIVALKRLLPHLAEDASFIKSFVREAKLASILNHVNIVQIFELGRVGTEYFISMEYIDGRDIRRILRHARKVTGPPPIHVTVGLMIQLCEALDYAHSKSDDTGHPLGLVHRDVSPSNLLVTSAGHLKVIDFGIAKAQSQQLRTQTGRVKGKLAYMAPEAVSGGRELDSRSDLFAAGVILHELLTARPLFASKNEYETLLKVQRGDVMPPSTFNQACPAELDAICLRALERDPDGRFSAAADMRDELHVLRRRMNLQTGHRDIAQWLSWAFSIEAPSSSFGAVGSRDHSVSFDARHMRRTPAPRREDDEAVEIAWGGGDAEGSAEPVVLDEVPDVSERHENSMVARLGAQASFAAALEDDIPISTPSHGYGAHAMAQLRDELDSIPELPAPPMRNTPMPAHRAPTAASLHAPSTARTNGGPNTPVPQLARPRTTSPHAVPTPHTPIPQRNTPPLPVVPRPTGSQPISRATPPPIPSSSGTFAPVPTRERRTTARGAGPAPYQTGDIPSGVHARSETDVVAPSPHDDSHGVPRAHPDTIDPELPQARYKPPTSPPGDLITARPSTSDLAETPRTKRPSDVTIGRSIIQRQSSKRTWVLLVGLGAAGAAATAVTLIATRGDDNVNAVSSSATPGGNPALTPERLFGTVKFMIEPPDAEIKLVEKQLDHKGSPWTTQLEPGVHQIQIQRDGYKAWLTSLELSANETQTLRVVLEPLSTEKAVVAEATLVLSSTPLGLEAFLDGRLLGVTPIKAQIKPGSHAIVLEQNGKEVWREDLNAKASATYEFSPSMTADKQRERAQRAAPVVTPERRAETPPAPTPPPAPAPSPSPADPTQLATQPPVDKTVEKPPVVEPKPPPSPVAQPTPPPPKPVTPAPTPTPAVAVPTPAPTAVPRPAGPVVVPPSAVQRLSGEMPAVGKSKRAEVPPVVAAKVCIDTTGKVSSVDMITKLERLTSVDLSHALHNWRYAPYKQGGVAVPACFVVSFRVQ